MTDFLVAALQITSTSNVEANNINISVNTDLDINCKCEKVIIKNTEHNFVSFAKDQIKRENIESLRIIAKNPDILVIKNLSDVLNAICNLPFLYRSTC